ncbi:MAG: cob(I)yrinic acid a,c-diamide adenosyltransferase [Candidatus Pacearchaeota archaeon]
MSKQIIIYYGYGEGKTSAAIGHAIRASNYGKVAIIFFMKGKETGEIKALKKLKNIEVYLSGPKEFLTNKTKQEHSQKVQNALKLTKKLITKNYFLIILDEILYASSYDLIKESEVLDIIKKSKSNLILTGGKVSKVISSFATILTEFKKIKHHYEKDKKTVKGIDY